MERGETNFVEYFKADVHLVQSNKDQYAFLLTSSDWVWFTFISMASNRFVETPAMEWAKKKNIARKEKLRKISTYAPQSFGYS